MYHVFSHLNADKSPQYRDVLDIFRSAKEAFLLHLRPSDIAFQAGLPEAEVGPLLDALEKWGNLRSLPDTADVATVEEFYRARYLYQLTAEGEAAERAMVYFQSALVQPGELQANALADILELLRRLSAGRAQDLHLVLASLCDLS